MNDNLPRQLAKLARPVPPQLVSQRTVGGGMKADYVGHAAITEMLLMLVGPFDLRLVDTVRDGTGSVVGAVVELHVTIDGRPTTVQEIGAIEHERGHDAERLKLAMSDGLKRCALRIGLASELWSRNGAWLYESIVRQVTGGDADVEPQHDGSDGPDPDGEQ